MHICQKQRFDTMEIKTRCGFFEIDHRAATITDQSSRVSRLDVLDRGVWKSDVSMLALSSMS